MRFMTPVVLHQLQDEMIAAGVKINGLGTTGNHLHTYDEDGVPTELPRSARKVIDAHVPAEDPTSYPA